MDPVRSHRFGESLELLRTEILEVERPLQELPGPFADEQRVGSRQPLETRGNVGGLSQREPLVASTASNVAYDHHAGVDANSKGNTDTVSTVENRVQFVETRQDFQPGPDRAMGVVFMGGRIAEIYEDTIAKILSDMAIEALNHRARGLLISSDQCSQIFRIEPAGQAGRVREVTEHDSDLTTLGLVGC